MDETAPLRLDNIGRTFVQGPVELKVLRGASITVEAGEIVALMGPSGAGKSTLLHIAGLLERPDDGEVWLGGLACGELNDDKRTGLRRARLGFVYQFHHLLAEFSALENVMLPQLIAGVGRAEATDRANELLAMVGLSERVSHRPARLSGGEQQRVAITRALANAPAVLLADEPTGNLDQETADQVFEELVKVLRRTSSAALIATHNPELASRMDRTVALKDGVLV
jgi:lipoprotein-releasing system ATP-binding protein